MFRTAQGAITLSILMAIAIPAGGRQEEKRLSRDEALAYMVQLINRDRETKGLKPVRLDTVATAAGQKHAEEMAAQNYMAHRNMEGQLPDQRYTAQGGLHYVRENVYLMLRFSAKEPSGALQMETEPTFTRKEIEDIEAAYFNERPPNDGHRRNILDPKHTHVGIALARAFNADAARTLANTQEFVRVYLEQLDPVPQTTAVGERVVVSGKTMKGFEFRAVAVGRDPLPSRMTVEELNRTLHYHTPPQYVTYRAPPYESPKPVQVQKDGRFRIEIPLSEKGQSGVYFVMVWVRSEEGGRDFLASQRTVVVK